MNQISTNPTKFALLLISSTFFAWWIEAFICSFIWNIPYRDLICLLSLYLFSLFLPAVGLLVFMKNTKKTSSRWYLGFPLLLGLILNTFIRDFIFMRPLEPGALWVLTYGRPFIATFDKWNLLERSSISTSPVINSISIFFSLSVALFCLSVPKEKRKKMSLPFVLSLITAISNLFLYVEFLMRGNRAVPNFFFVYSIAILILGFSFIRLAYTYDKQRIENQNFGSSNDSIRST